MFTEGVDLAGDAALRKKAGQQTTGWVAPWEKLAGIADFVQDYKAKRAPEKREKVSPTKTADPG